MTIPESITVGDFWFLVPHVRSLGVVTPSQQVHTAEQNKNQQFLRSVVRAVKSQSKQLSEKLKRQTGGEDHDLLDMKPLSRKFWGKQCLGRET